MTRPRLLNLSLWLLLLGLAALVVARARYSADLSAFLPENPTDVQRLLVGIGDGAQYVRLNPQV